MKKITRALLLLLMPAMIFLAGCVNLKHVHEFSDSAYKGLNKYEDLGSSFTQNCFTRCDLTQLKEHDITLACDCTAAEEADKVTTQVFNTLKGYFKGLANLSENDLTEYKTDDLVKAIKESDLAKIDDEEVKSYTKIANKVANAFTNAYRKKKIRDYITESDPDLQILLKALSNNLANLAIQLDTQKERYKSVLNDILIDKTVNAFEVNAAIAGYQTAVREIDKKKKEITSLTKAIGKIAEGHQVLAEHVTEMKQKEMKEALFKSACEIDEVISSFNQLKTK